MGLESTLQSSLFSFFYMCSSPKPTLPHSQHALLPPPPGVRVIASGRDVNELMEQCHPLGMFKESTMRLCTTFDNSPKGYADLYQVGRSG